MVEAVEVVVTAIVDAVERRHDLRNLRGSGRGSSLLMVTW